MTVSANGFIYDLPQKSCRADCPWPIRRIAEAAEVLGGGTPDTNVIEFWEPGEIPWATPTDITGTDGNEVSTTGRCISKAGLKQSTLVPENSVLMTSRATIGAAKINRVPMAINQGFAALCAKEGYDNEYLFYLLDLLRPTLIRLGAGTTFLETPRREIRKVRVHMPDGDEQSRIVAALKLADDAINKVRVECEATRDLRKAAAFALIERGIPLQHPSLNATKHWTIPTDWSVIHLKHLLSDMDAGASPMCESGPARPGLWGVLKVSAVSWDRFEDFENKALPPTIEADLAAEVRVGDIIVSRANTTGLCGAVHRVRSLYTRLLLCDKTWRLHPKDYVNPDWLVAVLKHPHARKQIEANATGTSDSMKNIAKRDFRNVLLPLPPKDEQDEIAAILNAIDAQAESNDGKLKALIEMKRSLIQNLLTGRIRVPHSSRSILERTSMSTVQE
jgi:type I restriction enzyme S subunit